VRLDRVLDPDPVRQLFEPLTRGPIVSLAHDSTMRRDAPAWGSRFVGGRP
jgi:hypothetical protein